MTSLWREAIEREIRYATRPDILRTDEERENAERIATEGRSMLARDVADDDASAWITSLMVDEGHGLRW